MSAKIKSILSLPACYRLFTRIVGGDVWRVHTREYIQPRAGEKVLDIGCGPADILEYLPGVDYLGLTSARNTLTQPASAMGTGGDFFAVTSDWPASSGNAGRLTWFWLRGWSITSMTSVRRVCSASPKWL